MMSPLRYSGRSGRKIHASVNINAGPMAQFRTSDIAREPRSANTGPIER